MPLTVWSRIGKRLRNEQFISTILLRTSVPQKFIVRQLPLVNITVLFFTNRPLFPPQTTKSPAGSDQIYHILGVSGFILPGMIGAPGHGSSSLGNQSSNNDRFLHPSSVKTDLAKAGLKYEYSAKTVLFRTLQATQATPVPAKSPNRPTVDR